MTLDENWLYHSDPQTKQQSTEWRRSGSLSPPPPHKKKTHHNNPLQNHSTPDF